jgi:hypothetical protein
MSPEQIQRELFNEEMETGILKMGTLGAFLLDKRVLELQEKAFDKGLEAQELIVRDWIKAHRMDLEASNFHNSDFGMGVRNTLADLTSFLNQKPIKERS